jgi:hypothetical protein
MSINEFNEIPFNYTTGNILCFTSLVLSFFFILMIKQKDSNYARIISYIVMSEGISIYCFFCLIVRGKNKDALFENIRNFSKFFFNKFTFNLLKDYEEKGNQVIFQFMNVLNLALFFSMEAFSLTFSIFICLELILVLRNPIAQMKSRFKPYFIFSLFLSLMIFVIICTISIPVNQSLSTEEYFFMDNVQL